ncbi:MAG: hypothetical protein ABWY06_24420 [Pseudomonas sp.]|uniref:hypothetical protein n=1 Tax=Pseudomonas sp. TaxID=306 RepID=UPI003398D17B
MKVIAASQIDGNAAVDDKALKAHLSCYLDHPPRRVDRLILQALLGAAVLQSRPRAESGLYLASSYPARPTMQALLEAVCVHGKLPKPFEFVNSVSNAAGFHVAQQLRLNGPNLFIGAGPDVWSDLTRLAGLDLAEGVIGQALLVLCDERDGFQVQALLLEPGDGGPLAGTDFASLTAGVRVTRLDLRTG